MERSENLTKDASTIKANIKIVIEVCLQLLIKSYFRPTCIYFMGMSQTQFSACLSAHTIRSAFKNIPYFVSLYALCYGFI